MSCHWGIRCVDCADTHRFLEANHQEELMQILCEHSGTIGALEVLSRDVGAHAELRVQIEPWGNLDVAWFGRHAAHRLVPIDEYGRLSGECGAWIKPEATACPSRDWTTCRLPAGHAGDHAPEIPIEESSIQQAGT